MKYTLISLFFSGFLFADPTVIKSGQLSASVYEKTFSAFHESKFFGNKLSAFHDPESNRVYIVVRGTEKIQNWLSNAHIGHDFLEHEVFDIFKKLTKSWFVLAFENLEQASEEVLAKYSGSKIIFVGHSYGGIMANLLAQSAYHQNPDLDFECHTFNAPGAKEIRTNTLKFKKLPDSLLKKRFFNHMRVTDIIGNVNTHEGQVLTYEAADRYEHLLEDHSMDYFAEDLTNGMQPL